VTKLTAVISYGLGIAGLGLVISALVPALTGFMNYREARAMLLNLLRSQPMRVESVARSNPGTFYEGIAAAVKIAAGIGTRDVAVIAQATRPSYDAAGAAVSQKAKQHIGRGKLGALMAGGAVVLALSKGAAPVILFILAGLCAIGLIALFWYKTDLDRTIVLARLEVLPEVDRAVAEGRIFKQG